MNNESYAIRRVDDLGRVVIPKEIRRMAKIPEGQPLKISYNNDGSITVTKYEMLCVYCNQPLNMDSYDPGHLCNECLNVLKEGGR